MQELLDAVLDWEFNAMNQIKNKISLSDWGLQATNLIRKCEFNRIVNGEQLENAYGNYDNLVGGMTPLETVHSMETSIALFLTSEDLTE